MTFRERIADWISGGALSRQTHRADCHRHFREMWFDDAMAQAGKLNCARSHLRRIAACETPKASHTVRKMAAIAREGLK